MRVITTDENYHTLLQPNRLNDVEVIEQTPIVCKVPVKGMLSPLKFNIVFKTSTGANSQDVRIKSGARKSIPGLKVVADLKVYASSSHKEPNE